MPETIVVFFRGRNTAAIMEDAKGAGIVPDGATVVVVARVDDPLAEPGDVTSAPRLPYPFPASGPGIVVVANGGTTALAIPVVAQCVYGIPPHKLRVVDVQRDGVVDLYGSFDPADRTT